MFRRVLVLAALLTPPLAAQEQAAGIQFDDIPWQQGPVLGDLGAEAEVKVPAGCMFTKGDGVRMFMELTENTTSPAERAVVFCPDSADNSSWFVSRMKRFVGNNGVRLSKCVFSFALSGSAPSTASTFNSAKKRSLSFGGRICPATRLPVCKSNRRICDGET